MHLKIDAKNAEVTKILKIRPKSKTIAISFFVADFCPLATFCVTGKPQLCPICAALKWISISIFFRNVDNFSSQTINQPRCHVGF